MDELFQQVDIETQEVDLDPVEQLVGEGKKFQSVQDLARAKLEADRFIERLKQEAAELRQEVSRQMTIEEIMTQIKNSQTPQAPQQSLTPEPRQPEVQDTPDIESVVEQLLSKKEAEKRQKENERVVADKLTSTFGQDAQLHLNKKARELGVSLEYLKGLAKESPQVFFRVTGLDAPAPQPAPVSVAPQSRVQALPQGTGARDKAFYERLKAQDRAKYFHPDTQLQLYKDMKKVLESGGSW